MLAPRKTLSNLWAISFWASLTPSLPSLLQIDAVATNTGAVTPRSRIPVSKSLRLCWDRIAGNQLATLVCEGKDLGEYLPEPDQEILSEFFDGWIEEFRDAWHLIKSE